jgi:hypothetical protein
MKSCDRHWNSVYQSSLNGNLDKEMISHAMQWANDLDEKKRIESLNLYLSQRNKWSVILPGKNWRELYRQHFPEDTRI